MTTEPDRPRAGRLRLAGWLAARASERMSAVRVLSILVALTARMHRFGSRAAVRGPKAPRRSGAPPSAQSCAAGAHVCALKEPHMYFELDPIQIIWNCVVKVP